MDEFEPSGNIQDRLTHGRGTQLPPLETSLSTRPSQRLQRPRRTQTHLRRDGEYVEQNSVEEPKVKRQASKGRLLGIFGKAKSSKDVKAPSHQALEAENDDVGQREDDHKPARQVALSQESGNSMAAERLRHGEAAEQQPSKATRSKSFKKQPSSTKSVPWNPPPLFQAYPQSVKHATLSAPTMPADAVLRFQSDRKRKPRRKYNNTSSARITSMAVEEEGLKDDGDEDLQLGDWSQKIYVLVTSGYVLQYAGEGSFDRLPEKIMPIGKDSAAFASDAIPGKHWVVQVSHVLDENGSAKTETSWSFFKRLGFGGGMKGRSASNFLLVLDNPDDLDSWLSAVRREIESWGGNKYQADTAVRPNADEQKQTLQQRPSRRYLVKRDPHQFSSNARDTNAPSSQAFTDAMPTAIPRKSSATTQDSIHSPSVSNAITSADQCALDRLRNSPRMSYLSTSAKTYSTSRDSSPVLYPTKSACYVEDSTSSRDHWETADRSGTITGQAATHYFPPQLLDHSSPSTLPRLSSTVRSSPGQTPSAGAPNFSVPSFSRRYSSAHSTPPLSTASSSSASNLPRKSASPATINENIDAPQDISFAVEAIWNRDQGLAEEPIAYPLDTGTLSLEKPKATTPELYLQAPSSDRAVPRRFSSLEYSRGISPVNLRSSHSHSPHPPPTSALPALLESSNNIISGTLRRPTSVSVDTSVPSPSYIYTQPSLPPISSPTADDDDQMLPPPSRVPPPRPDLSSSQGLLSPMKIMNHRSMPHLSRPPYDPPDCPLPTPPIPRLPPIKRSTGSLRRSVERPLRAGLGARTPGLVEVKDS